MIVWITGGGSGIGRALAAHYYRRGDCVAIFGRRESALAETAQWLEASKSQRFRIFVGDVTSPGHAQEAVSDIERVWGPVDILINNAGNNNEHSTRTAKVSDYLSAFELNCLGGIRCVDAVLPAMRARGSGAIVNISSIYGKWGSENSATYSVAKYAVTGYSDVLRQGLIGTGIQVLCVYPGFIKTDMTMPFVKAGSLKERLGAQPESIAAAIARAIERGSRELYYPFYVKGLLALHALMPSAFDRLGKKFRQNTETRR